MSRPVAKPPSTPSARLWSSRERASGRPSPPSPSPQSPRSPRSRRLSFGFVRIETTRDAPRPPPVRVQPVRGPRMRRGGSPYVRIPPFGPLPRRPECVAEWATLPMCGISPIPRLNTRSDCRVGGRRVTAARGRQQRGVPRAELFRHRDRSRAPAVRVGAGDRCRGTAGPGASAERTEALVAIGAPRHLAYLRPIATPRVPVTAGRHRGSTTRSPRPWKERGATAT